MITGMVFVLNADFQSERDWGYTQDHTYAVRLNEDGQYAALKNEVEQNPNVLAVAGSRHHLGRSWGLTVVDVKGEKLEATRFNVGFDYLETVGLRLKEGRFFAEHFGSDADQAVLINETFARSQGWHEAVGQQIRADSTAMTVVGVVEDFHYDDFYDPIRPTMFFVADEANHRYLTMKVNAGTGIKTAEGVEASWKRLFPDQPYNGFFQDTVFEEFYRETTNIKRLFAFVALMALIISCMGLFGLAAQNIARRMKEISIRKVLGATVASVTTRINRGFLALLLIAAVIAIPLSYALLNALLNSIYPAPMPLGPAPFVWALVLVFITATGAISSLIYKVVTTNPAEVLRNE